MVVPKPKLEIVGSRPVQAPRKAVSLINEELDYTIPNRPLVCAWIFLALLTTSIGFWSYSTTIMLMFLCAILLWMSFYSTALHYALDAEEFTRLPLVGEAFVTFQSHHFPRWINTIHRKPVVDLLGELNFVSMVNLVVPVLIFRFRYREVFVAWGTLMLVACYGMLCHRWAHTPTNAKPRIASALQQAHLALRPSAHWKHHAQVSAHQAGPVQNYDLSFGWSNTLFNRVVKVLPSPRLWLAFIVVTTLTQVSALAMLLRWLQR
jgi:hypothetical protein